MKCGEAVGQFGVMKQRFLVVALLFCAVGSYAKERTWQDAVFLGTQTTQNGVGIFPVGTAIIAAPLGHQYFYFRSEGLGYVLSFPPRLSGRIPLLTVNGHAKFSPDGRKAYVVDDTGKQWKFSVVEKVAAK